MRSLTILAVCLGLAAVVYAQDAAALEQLAVEAPTKVLLKGIVADEDMLKTPARDNPSALHAHAGDWRHWHHRGPPHEPRDAPYWQRRHAAKEELLRCIHYAIDDFDISRSWTWKHTGKALAHCFLEHLGHCHDIPSLGDDITRSLPFIMASQGLTALVESGDQGLQHARLVFSFYFASTVPLTPTGAPNPFYNADGCASKLAALLHTGCHHADQQQIWALAKLVVKFIESAYSGEQDLGLGGCAPDIPAVVLSLFSSGCPAREYLWDPLTSTRVPCTYRSDNQFEDSPAALLGGSIYTLLLLSGKPSLQAIGAQVAFAANRFAVATTQTTDLTQCLATSGLATTLADVPIYSGVVPGTPPFQAATPLTLGPDGLRVLCMTIAMMSGDPSDTTSTPPYAWANNLMWQATADIANAIFKTIAANPGVVDAQQVAGLCGVGRALWRFSSQEAPITTPGAVTVTIPGATGTTETDLQCMTNSVAGSCTLPWGFATEPLLAATHDLSSASLIGRVCWPANGGRRLLQ